MAKNILSELTRSLLDRMKNVEWVRAFANTHLGYYLKRVAFRVAGIEDDIYYLKIACAEDVQLKTRHPLDEDRFKVLFILPPLPSNYRHKRIINMGVTYIAAYLGAQEPEANVGILDAQVYSLNAKETLEKVFATDWDVIGFTYWTVQADFVNHLSVAIKKIRPDITLVHGGVHPTIDPKAALEYADVVVLHEGEITMSELVRALRDGGDLAHVQGLAYMHEGEMVKTEARPFIKSLDDLPFPAYDLLPIEEYKMPLHVVGGDRLPIIGSRGCPYNCSFCVSPLLWKRKVRWRSPENVVDEMEERINTFCITKFHFWDDNFTINRKFVTGLCSEIKERGLDIEWICLDRAEHVIKNHDLLPIMRDAGCIGIEIGLESSNPDTFDLIHKDQQLWQSKEALKHIRESGIYPLYTCMAFNPGETTIGYYLQKEFLDMAQDGYPWFQFFHPRPYPVYIGQFATPYPGTRFMEYQGKHSLSLLEEPTDLYHHQINSVPLSLLEDIPIRTIEKPDHEIYYLWLDMLKTGFWTYFPGDDSPYEMGLKLKFGLEFLRPFLAKCNGRLTVREIANQLANELNMRLVSSIRLTVYAIYILAQVGVVRSALYLIDYPIERKRINIPAGIKLDLLAILRTAGVTKKDFV